METYFTITLVVTSNYAGTPLAADSIEDSNAAQWLLEQLRPTLEQFNKKHENMQLTIVAAMR